MNLLELFTPIRTFIFDVDGVLTDGTLLATEDGELLRKWNNKDAYALKTAIKKGYKVWGIYGVKSNGVHARLNELGAKEIHSGIYTRKESLQEIAVATQTPYENMLYMGADIPDHAAMQICGLPCCPANAVAEIKSKAKYISPYNGGEGCVRDVIEKVLKLNGDWQLPQ